MTTFFIVDFSQYNGRSTVAAMEARDWGTSNFVSSARHEFTGHQRGFGRSTRTGSAKADEINGEKGPHLEEAFAVPNSYGDVAVARGVGCVLGVDERADEVGAGRHGVGDLPGDIAC